MDHEFIEQATQHDLPIFISIDGSLDDNEKATVTKSIIAPDIGDAEELGCSNWHYKRAKVLLIQSWHLPKYWGTGGGISRFYYW